MTDRVCIVVHEEPTGGFSSFCANLPGAASQGETRKIAFENCIEATQGCLDQYREEGKSPPYSTTRPVDTGDPSTFSFGGWLDVVDGKIIFTATDLPRSMW